MKFNKLFDLARLCADYLNNAPSQTFEKYLECFQQFSRYLRDGMPPKVVDFLMNPSLYDLVEREESVSKAVVESEVVRESESEKESFEEEPAENTNNFSNDNNPQFVSVFKEIPLNLRESASVDAMVKTMPGDGACLYNCASDWLYGSHKHMADLRREAHNFIVENFNFYKQFITLPYSETVGVGPRRTQITCINLEGLKTYNS